MKFSTQAMVRGMTHFKDTVEGVAYDFTKMFVESELDTSKGAAMGSCTTPYEFGTSAEYLRMEKAGVSFPFMAALEMELVTTGKTTKQRILSCKPISVEKPASAVVK
ncbi:MAG: hypothetical protein LLG15_01535 [Betaproteobacteria bacterium]|nr:hypothetical protein [Betaproteobacteria bacterium]